MQRKNGILLHISSLPSPYGIGDLGPEAHAFVDFLARSKQSCWQILPLNPTNSGTGNSPYNAYSASAGNPLFISPDVLMEQGMLCRENVTPSSPFAQDHVEYARVVAWKNHLLKIAFESALPWLQNQQAYTTFCSVNGPWLEDYALFAALKEHLQGLPWYYWPEDLKCRKTEALSRWQQKLSLEIEREKFKQFLFFQQWQTLKNHCNQQGITILGDMPIYVSLDSCDVWSHPELFVLDSHLLPIFVAGAPPDYFSTQGQLWGNPVYDWEQMESTGFSWWVERLRLNGTIYDAIRLDHFRGFAAFWQVAAGEKTAENGVWRPSPGKALLTKVRAKLPDLELIAEDLGYITDDVRELMAAFGLPGMKILQFAFSANLPENPYIPHNIPRHSVVYTGTHDNNTLKGWYQQEAQPAEKAAVQEYLGLQGRDKEIPAALIRTAMMSVANLCILPLQDLLELGAEARMNTPSKTDGNWGWRVTKEQLSSGLAIRLARMTWLYGRSPAPKIATKKTA
ncbi:MAG: 4-alpha-glucanotransferase [Desulfoplanes sp.]|nr:4-alpha-glucanotransferase [Desulfoplanes sp.]MDD4649274.1 4-alpha-glucanotransferase [Desulfoplanes sp.]